MDNTQFCCVMGLLFSGTIKQTMLDDIVQAYAYPLPLPLPLGLSLSLTLTLTLTPTPDPYPYNTPQAYASEEAGFLRKSPVRFRQF